MAGMIVAESTRSSAMTACTGLRGGLLVRVGELIAGNAVDLFNMAVDECKARAATMVACGDAVLASTARLNGAG